MENNEAIGNELQKQVINSEGQGGNGGDVINYETQYKTLQAEFDKRNEERIELALKLAKKDKREILELPEKIQKKVIKEIYGLDNLEELKLIHGDRFYEEKNENDGDEDEDRTTRLEKELLLLKYNQSKSQLENGIDDYKKSNSSLFGTEDAERKLRDELKYISAELPTKERIERAAKIAFGINSTDAAYLALIQTNGSNSASKSTLDEKAKTALEEEVANIFRKRFRKK